MSTTDAPSLEYLSDEVLHELASAPTPAEAAAELELRDAEAAFAAIQKRDDEALLRERHSKIQAQIHQAQDDWLEAGDEIWRAIENERIFREQEHAVIGALRRQHGVILPRVEGVPAQARRSGEEAYELRKRLERNVGALQRGV